MPNFNNRENERVDLPDGRVIFLARSTAVVGCVLCLHGNDVFVLMVERGDKVDNSGKWCMPCGYLDWDETLDEAIKREVWEETGLNLDEVIDQKRALYARIDQPYYIGSSPKSNRQNISHHFGLVMEGPPPELKASEALASGEATAVEWVRLSTIPTRENIESSGLSDYFAFNHNEDIHRFFDIWKKAQAKQASAYRY